MEKKEPSTALRILLVEANRRDAQAFRRAFREREPSSTITVKERAETALELIIRDHSAFDVVVTDHRLPGMTGLELLDELLIRKIPLPKVILTGSGSEHLAAIALKSGVDDYIIKDPDRGYLELVTHILPGVAEKYYDHQTRRQAKEALRTSEERMRDFLDKANDLIQMVEPDGRFAFVNRKWREVLRYSEEEVSGLTLFDVIHPDSMAHCMDLFQKVIAGETVDNIEAKFIAKDGTLINVEGSASCRFENGKPASTRGIFRDVTDRKRAEEALRQSEGKYRTLFEQSRDVIYITAVEGQIIDINQAAKELFGYSRKEMLRMNARELYVNPTDRDRLHREIIKSGYVRDFEVKFHRKDGTEIDCLLTTTTRRTEDGTIVEYQGIIRDITEQKRAEEERERLIQKLKEALTKIKTLGGLIPICASCKKIRDDEGYWQQIEAYIQEHSDAEFTHGICPECIEKLYPQYADDKKKS